MERIDQQVEAPIEIGVIAVTLDKVSDDYQNHKFEFEIVKKGDSLRLSGSYHLCFLSVRLKIKGGQIPQYAPQRITAQYLFQNFHEGIFVFAQDAFAPASNFLRDIFLNCQPDRVHIDAVIHNQHTILISRR